MKNLQYLQLKNKIEKAGYKLVIDNRMIYPFSLTITKKSEIIFKIRNVNDRVDIAKVQFFIENASLAQNFHMRFYKELNKILNIPTNKRLREIKFIYGISDDSWSKSQNSNSYYSRPNDEIDYNTKPLGSLRLSNHWNFKTSVDDKIHGKLVHTDKYIKNHWYLAEYTVDGYKIIQDIGDSLIKATKS
jgi:hypothetical protein